MFGLEIGFNKPWWLLLLAVLPALWLFSYRSLAGLGLARRGLVLAIRSLVVLAFVLALAEVQLVRVSDKLTVIYLLDQSQSIPLAQRQTMMRYVVSAFEKHRQRARQDRVGVIVFGADAKIEIPPFTEIASIGNVESAFELRTDATNLAAAVKLARASFPNDSARRIVVVSDGNENRGNAKAEARLLSEDGIGIDVVPVHLPRNAEVEVEKITLPSEIRQGQPVETRVVLNNLTSPSPDNPRGLAKGKLFVRRQSGTQTELLNEQEVELKPGKNVFTFQEIITHAAAYTYLADFTPRGPQDDFLTQNNRATAITHVKGKGRVLLIEDWQNKGDADFLVNRLRENKIEVDLVSSDALFASPQELLPYDAVILADIPRSSGEDGAKITHVSDEQVEMLVRNTEQMGAGLIMLGGPNSYGAGGWANTKLEEAMPVDFQIKNTKINAVGALAIVLDKSGSMAGLKIEMARSAAIAAVKTLGSREYATVVAFDGAAVIVSPMQRMENRARVISRIERLGADGGTNMLPGMEQGYQALRKTDASVKHMIVLTDGRTLGSGFESLAGKMKDQGITTTAVAVGSDADQQLMNAIALAGGGKFYNVLNPRAIPRIFVREARRISRPLIYEPDGGVSPQVVYPHEALAGIEGPLPPIKGFLLTTVKDNPLVEVSIRSPKPDDAANSTILASWTYGLGRTAVLTTDAGKRWADSWTEWPNYDKLFSQLVRWSMRPSGDEGRFTVATDIKDGKVRVVVTALDKDDEFLNFLNLSGSALDPNLKGSDVKFVQTAPGRYVGEFSADQAGSYFVTVVPGAGKAPILAGVNVPYSSEFRERETNRELLTTLASLKPKGGEVGEVVEGTLTPEGMPKLLKTDNFRHNLAKAVSSQDVWPLFILVAAGIFFLDVLVRRVTIPWDWIKQLWETIRIKVFRRVAAPVVDERMARLKSRKAAVGQSIDERRAATRFEPQVDADPSPSADDISRDATTALAAPATPRPTSSQIIPGPADEQDYTARLLKAKQKAIRDKK